MANPETFMGGGEIGEEVGCRANLISYYFGISEEVAKNPVFQREFFKYAMYLKSENQIANALKQIGSAEQSGDVTQIAGVIGGLAGYTPNRVSQDEDGQVVITNEVFEPSGVEQCQNIHRIRVLDGGGIGVYNHHRSVLTMTGDCPESSEARATVVARGYDSDGKLRNYARLQNWEGKVVERAISPSDVDFSDMEDFDEPRDGTVVDMVEIYPSPESGSRLGRVLYHVQREDSFFNGGGEVYASGVSSLYLDHGATVYLDVEKKETGEFRPACLNSFYDAEMAGEFYEAIYGTKPSKRAQG